MEALRRIWVQQYTRNEDGRVSTAGGSPHGAGSPAGQIKDHLPLRHPGALFSVKRGKGWDGYKIHLTETCAGPAGSVNLITNVATTAAPVPDVVMTEPVHDMLTRRGPGAWRARRRRRVYLRAAAAGRPGPGYHPDRPRWPPMPPRKPAPAATPPTCSPSTGTIERVTCPQGTFSTRWTPTLSSDGNRQIFIVVQFPAAACRACPARGLCTTSARRGRQLALRPREIHEAITAARAEQAGQPWKDRYKIRAGVEGTIRQATHVTGIRTARYRGLPKTSLEHAAAAAAINLTRLDAWWTSNPLDPAPPRATHLQRLNLTTAA